MMRTVVVLTALLTVAIGATPSASTQLFPGLPFDSRQFKFEILDNNHLRLTGEVELEGEGWQFYADQVDLFTDKNQLVATGNVVYVADGARLAAERAELNTNDLTGIFYNASGSVNMEEEIDRNMFGSLEPDMYFYGETVEKVAPRIFRLSKGGFTSCVQPTPRWELTSSSFTINLDDYVLLRNTVLEVKGVPVFYLPIMYYPIHDDKRATGLLMPTYKTSTFRGPSLQNALFWAIGRSQDVTFLHDWFMNGAQGGGAEYRYVRDRGFGGNLQTYFLNETDPILPTRRSYEVRGDARQQITPNITARGNVDFFSDITVRQTYQNHIFDGSNRERSLRGNITGLWGTYQLSGTYDTNETFFGDTSATLWGSGPRLNFGQGQQAIPGTPFYYSFDTEYARLLRRTTFDLGGDKLQTNSNLHRIDINPTLQIPFTRWPFLTMNSTISFQSTYWTESVDASTGTQVPIGILRNFVDLQSRITGPTFVKVWDTPDSTYSERMKHVVEPHLTLQRTSKIDQFNEIVRLEGVDFIMGNTTQVSYGLTNRMYARLAADSGAGAIRQILTVGLTQTYYTNDQAAQFDRRFSTSFNDTSPSNFSPVTLTVRGVPTDDLSTSMRAEYDTKFNALRTIGINGTYDFKNLIQATAGWSQRRLVEDLEGFNNPHQSDHYLHAQTRVQNRGNTLGGSYTMHYDLLRGRLLQQGVGVYYNAQCCGVSVDYQEFNFQGIGQRAPVPQDHRLNFSFTLAGLNTFTSAFGANGGSR